MRYYLVTSIDVRDLKTNPTIKHLQQHDNEEDAKLSLKEEAISMVEKKYGENQVKYALTEKSLTEIGKASTSIFPAGFYIKENNKSVHIYEKLVVPGRFFGHKKIIQLARILCVTTITVDNNMNIRCEEDNLYQSICYKPNNMEVTYIDELKEVLKKRKEMKEIQEIQEKKEEKKKEEVIIEIPAPDETEWSDDDGDDGWDNNVEIEEVTGEEEDEMEKDFFEGWTNVGAKTQKDDDFDIEDIYVGA